MVVRGKARYDGALDIPAAVDGRWAVEHVREPAGKLFPLANHRTMILGGDRRGSVVFTHPTRWHVLTEGKQRWMSDYPIEQAQHDRQLREVRGTVLVGGLGLGYAATVLARKRAVSRVVVVEKSPEVVRLVAPHLPRAKISVVCEDLFDYLRHYHLSEQFDWGFYDIWASDGESTFFHTVCPLLKLSAKVARRVICWNENVMRGQLYFSLESSLLQLDPKWDAVGVERVTLDALCEKRASIWWDWKVPFFRWVRAAKPDPERQRSALALYAQSYGLLGFDWKRLGQSN